MASSLDLQTLNPSANPPPQQQPQPPPQPPTSSSSQSPQLSNFLSTPKPSTPSPQIPKIQDPSQLPPQGILYPLASSGRGLMPKTYRQPQPTDQLVTAANPGGFTRNNALQFPNQARPFGVSASNNHTPSSMRPPSQFGPRFMGGGGTGSGALRSSSPAAVNQNNKTAPFPSPNSSNGYRDSRDSNRDDTVVAVNHRKVRLSDGTSLYALCRSWVRNGLPKETQPQFGEGLKILPRPLPMCVANTQESENNGSGGEDEEKEEDVSSVENLSARELLQIHVKRAKKVRARLRKQRLQRIERYKQRLALLLPSPVEQFRNETSTEN